MGVVICILLSCQKTNKHVASLVHLKRLGSLTILVEARLATRIRERCKRAKAKYRKTAPPAGSAGRIIWLVQRLSCFCSKAIRAKACTLALDLGPRYLVLGVSGAWLSPCLQKRETWCCVLQMRVRVSDEDKSASRWLPSAGPKRVSPKRLARP